MNPGRIRRRNGAPVKNGPVVYWMSRDQRVSDNWALLYAGELALKNKQPLHAAFCLSPFFLGAGRRQYVFMLRGLREAEEKLLGLNISFHMLQGDPPREIAALSRRVEAGAVVADFSPLGIASAWKNGAAESLEAAFFEVDAHNIVPCWKASGKQEYAAYTFRPKIKRLTDEYLEGFPRTSKHPHGRAAASGADWDSLEANLKADGAVPEVDRPVPGEKEAYRAMDKFLRKGLSGYDALRNDPNSGGQSGLSPYLHFGQLSPQRLATEVSGMGGEGASAFFEELVVRRELADNFCYYNKNYDSVKSFPGWAAESHEKHGGDKREYIYSLPRFESGRTHDELWNAAQLEMVKTGKMHGYMRMYWAKKILEWTRSPREAVKTAVYLNDRYELDGRDPGGYAGIMWAVGGVHDRAWPERPVFGKIRYMNYNGCRSKFNVDRYISRVRSL